MVLIVPLIFELFFDWWNLMKKKIWNRCRKMVRYDKIFSIIDIKEENMKKWGKCFHFIRMYKKRGLFFGRQLKRTCTILAPVEQNIICFTGAFFN